MDILKQIDQRSFKQRLAHETNMKIRELMIGIASQPVTMLEIVAAGPYVFRQRFLDDFRGMPVDGNVADMVFKFFCEKVVAFYGEPNADVDKAVDQAGKLAGKALDKVELPTPLTEEEIEKSWKLEIASSVDAMEQSYKGSARVRDGADMGEKKVH